MATQPESAEPKAYSMRGASAAYNVSTKTLQRAIYSGQLKAKKLSPTGKSKYLIDAKSLAAWYESLTDVA